MSDYEHELRQQYSHLRKLIKDTSGTIAQTDNFSIHVVSGRAEVRFKPCQGSKYKRELFVVGGYPGVSQVKEKLTEYVAEMQKLIEQLEKAEI